MFDNTKKCTILIQAELGDLVQVDHGEKKYQILSLEQLQGIPLGHSILKADAERIERRKKPLGVRKDIGYRCYFVFPDGTFLPSAPADMDLKKLKDTGLWEDAGIAYGTSWTSKTEQLP